MNNTSVRVLLNTTLQQGNQLRALQLAFSKACNSLMPLVRQTRCWNRVALHHMAYRRLRDEFPELGSQMACNAIYSVSRTCRRAFQHPTSPFNLQRLAAGPLPNLRFLPESPVYFDRHTLSLRDGNASLYTLDGRIRFSVDLPIMAEQRFRQDKLRETVLTSEAETFVLTFHLQARGEPSARTTKGQPAPLELDHVRVTHDVQGAERPDKPEAATDLPPHDDSLNRLTASDSRATRQP